MDSQITKKLACGATLTLASIRTQEELIALDLALAYEDLLGIQQQIARHIITHDMSNYKLQLVDAMTLLDAEVGAHELAALASALRAASVPPQADLDAVIALAYLLGLGGCECRICADRLGKRAPTKYEQTLCKFYGTPRRAFTLHRLASPHRHASLLTQPPALTAITTAIKIGEGRAIKERVKEREREARLSKFTRQ